MQHLSEQEILRRESLAALNELGIDPFPAATWEVTAYANDIKNNFNPNVPNYQHISIAGRLMMTREMGKAAFAELQDQTGRIQLYIGKDNICPTDDKTLFDVVFKKLMDIGDFIGVTGDTFLTKTGEITLKVKELKLLGKSLKPLPVVKTDAEGNTFDALSDP
ncbi:MAG: lysine--tRNA ligase, partial [Saprospiraceae bacterium]|nr:lysine--tRNA ligase [Saprospiraceae bacterium]